MISELSIFKANVADWESILKLVEDAKYSYWLNGSENYEDYYLMKDKDNSVVCCFAIITQDKVGILKHFIISKNLQGKGFGKKIANNTVPGIAKELGLSKLYLLSDNQEPYISYHFWKKTLFIKLEDLNNVGGFFKTYLDEDKNEHPEYESTRIGFYLDITRIGFL